MLPRTKWRTNTKDSLVGKVKTLTSNLHQSAFF